MNAPLYQVVIDTVVERIASGAWAPGAMLPSETQLGAQLGVSQGTARKALMALEARGLISRVQGRGTFVSVRTPETALFRFFRLRRPDGTLVRPELVSETVRRRRAQREERGALFGAPTHLFEIERVRAIDGQACVHEVSVVPVDLFPALDTQAPLPNTLYVHYQQAYRCVVVRADEALRAGPAEAATGAALGVSPGHPVLTVERRAIDMLERTVELRRSACLTERTAYHVNLE